MKTRSLGKSGIQVSEIGHGLWGMGGWKDSDDAQSRAAIRRSIEGGVTFFDSAAAYGDGYSDALIGEVAGDYPERGLILASKVPPKNGKWPSDPRDTLHDIFPRDHVLATVAQIAAAFKRPIDVLQLHVWEDDWTEVAEFQDTVAELKESGAIRAFGISLNRWQPENGIKAVETGLIDCVQVIYNIFDQAPEDALFPACRAAHVGVIARVPLDEGSLGGKLTLDTTFPPGDWRAGYFKPKNLARTVERIEALKAELPEGMSLPEMAMRFILSDPAVSTIIPGMRKAEHVTANIACSDQGPLPADLIARLRAHRWDRTTEEWR